MSVAVQTLRQRFMYCIQGQCLSFWLVGSFLRSFVRVLTRSVFLRLAIQIESISMRVWVILLVCVVLIAPMFVVCIN